MLRAIMLLLFVFSSCVSQTVNDDDRKILITVNDFKEYDLIFPGNYKKYEKYNKYISLDGTSTIEYEYEYSPADEKSDITFISQRVEYHLKKSDQLVSDKFGGFVVKSILKSYGVSMKEPSGMFKNRQDTKVFSLTSEGYDVGNMLVVSFDRMTFSYTLVGQHIKDPEVWSDIFAEKVDLATKYKASFYKIDYNK
ncbi:hypothetical protein [Leptospira sarikeiensis]|uniref:Lipoprotein n=1 Tax=Leptospira sarikeiensis TaxID=2484943 RepID=A0A4R9KCM5_9LEPT|nr:hypothetical protein [Leptospira sarikeiensis]TGL64679.1 hypothetical protein EHQ64_02185 [Leptospira sarikeiensis]